jgi:septal ring factor EnvC (AmiA/AmiB activator)
MPTIAELLPVLALLISAAALWRNIKGDSKNDGAQISEILVKMELVQSDLKEIKADFKAEIKGLKADFENMKDRITVVEQSLKSAHKRIDEMHEEGKKA